MPWNQTRNDIIKRALRIVGAVAQGDNPNPEQVSEASDALNAILKDLANDNINLWRYDWIQVYPTASSEVIGSDGLNYSCIKAHTSSAANQPVTGAQWKTYWTQHGTAGVAWVTATAYTAINELFIDDDILEIKEAFYRYNNTDTPVELLSAKHYLQMHEKDSFSNIATQAWFDKKLIPTILLWPIPENTDWTLHLHVERLTADLITAGGTPSLPLKYFNMLVYALAENIADEYGVNVSECAKLSNKALIFKQKCRSTNREDISSPFIEGAF